MSDRWDRVGRLFEQALGVPPEARSALIEQSGEPADIRDEAHSLLAAHESADTFLAQPAAAVSDLPAVVGSGDPADASSDVLTEGTQLGPYRIGPIIAEGGMGIVYRAEDTRLHRPVALKALSPRWSGEDRQRQRLRQEARAAAALAHPGIAVVHALEEIDNHIFIVSELLEGETLRAEMLRGRLTLADALGSGLEIARALAAAHDRGVVHRDLKPENIIRLREDASSRQVRLREDASSRQVRLREDASSRQVRPGEDASARQVRPGALKILDFGLAQLDPATHDLASLARLTQSGAVVGTPPYMAPEQLLGHKTDFRADQFAFGVVLYELTTGRHPFGGGSLPSIIARILAAEPAPPRTADDVPEDVWQVIGRCLEKDPAARFETTHDLVRALELAAAEFVRPALAPAVAPALALARGRTSTLAPAPALLRWWRFHQFAAAVVYWAMVWPGWHVHRSIGRFGLLFFFALLAAVVVAANLRLHLWFSSRVYPEDLPAQRAAVARWIRWADIAFAALLVVGGIALPEDRAGWASVLIAVGIGSALAFLFIEPATARAAFRDARK